MSIFPPKNFLTSETLQKPSDGATTNHLDVSQVTNELFTEFFDDKFIHQSSTFQTTEHHFEDSHVRLPTLTSVQITFNSQTHIPDMLNVPIKQELIVDRPHTIPPPAVTDIPYETSTDTIQSINEIQHKDTNSVQNMNKLQSIATINDLNNHFIGTTLLQPTYDNIYASTSKPKKELLRDLFGEHGTTWKMTKYATETGIKEDYCRRLVNSLKKGDDITNKKKRGPHPKHSLELFKEIIQEVKVKGKSTREASKQLKVSPSSICRYMKKEEMKSLMLSSFYDQSLGNVNENDVVGDVQSLPLLTQLEHEHLGFDMEKNQNLNPHQLQHDWNGQLPHLVQLNYQDSLQQPTQEEVL
ncbi:hypothetical protein QTN25_004501 [Entamoeba marina]